MTSDRKKPSGPLPSGRLFDEPSSAPAQGGETFTANIDGAARGNPGPASYGVVLRKPDGSPLESLGKYIGRTTNNVAEYYALIAALDYAAAHGIRRLRVHSDSQLIVNQIKGLYKVKHPDLRPLHERAKKQAAALESFLIQYVPRERNREADSMANAALDNTGGVRPAFAGGPSRPDSPQAPQARADSKPRKFRARFRDGVLVPAEPLDLEDGAVVEITLERSRN